MTKRPNRAPESFKEKFFNLLTRFVLHRHFQRMKLAKQDTNYIEQQLMIKTDQGAKRIGVVTLQFIDGMTPADKVNIAEALAAAEQIKAEMLKREMRTALQALYSWVKAEAEHFGANIPDDDMTAMVEAALATERGE